MLTTPRWSHIAEVWGEFDREDLTLIWHNLDGTNLLESAETNMTNKYFNFNSVSGHHPGPDRTQTPRQHPRFV